MVLFCCPALWIFMDCVGWICPVVQGQYPISFKGVKLCLLLDMPLPGKNNLQYICLSFRWCLNGWYSIGLQLLTYSPKKSHDLQLVMRFMQGVISIGLVVALCLIVAFTGLSIPDLFASILGFVPTGWAILCVSVTTPSFSCVGYLSHNWTCRSNHFRIWQLCLDNIFRNIYISHRSYWNSSWILLSQAWMLNLVKFDLYFKSSNLSFLQLELGLTQSDPLMGLFLINIFYLDSSAVAFWAVPLWIQEPSLAWLGVWICAEWFFIFVSSSNHSTIWCCILSLTIFILFCVVLI